MRDAERLSKMYKLWFSCSIVSFVRWTAVSKMVLKLKAFVLNDSPNPRSVLSKMSAGVSIMSGTKKTAHLDVNHVRREMILVENQLSLRTPES